VVYESRFSASSTTAIGPFRSYAGGEKAIFLRIVKEVRGRANEALTPGGTIAIAEILVDAERKTAVPALIFAVNMLANSDDGGTFSFDEIRSWLQDAGFERVRTVEAPGSRRYSYWRQSQTIKLTPAHRHRKTPSNEHVLGERPILYFGIPAVLISSEHEDGSFNLAPMSSAFLAGMTLYFGAQHNVKNDGKLETHWRVHAKTAISQTSSCHQPARADALTTRGRKY
jgi:hypothetical protein